MELTRKVFLQSIYDSGKISPKNSKFVDSAESFIYKHYGIVKADLASHSGFLSNLRTLKSRASSYMGGSGFKSFIQAETNQVLYWSL